MATRLNKYLSQSGLGSRRSVESLISSGRVSINGKKVTALGTLVEPGDRVALDGSRVEPRSELHYLLLHKPRGYVTTIHDDRGRLTVMDLIPEKYRRAGVFPVGRLDRDTSGLLLFTNDGDLAFRLTKPRFHVTKEYEVSLDRPLEESDRAAIARGVYIHQLEIKTGPTQVECLDETRLRVRVILTEGKNRQIRYTFLNLGYKVKSLERTAYGMLSLRRLKKGAHRALTDSEIRNLKKAAAMK